MPLCRGGVEMIRSVFSVVLIAIMLAAVSCTCRGGSEGAPGTPQGAQTPGEPQIVFTTDRNTIQPGECVNLSWSIQGEGFFGVELQGQAVNASGQKQVCPSESTVYALMIDIGSTVLRREVMVEVAGTGTPQQPSQPGQPQQPSPAGCPGAPIFSHFEANPGFVESGKAVTLEWGPVTNGTSGELVNSVVLSPGGFGEVGSPGSRVVYPTSSTTYVLTATGCGGTATKTVQVGTFVIGTPVPITPPPATPPGGGGWSGPPKVISVVAQANPSNYNGPCPKVVTTSADITVDGPCTVTYRWERIDGATGPVETLVFSAAGTKTVSTSWMIYVASNVTYWERVSILTPLPMMSNQASFTITCTP